MMEVLNDFKYGLELYRNAKWRPALTAFEKALSSNPQDRLSQVYVDRCKYYEAHPPGPGWDRVWTMTSK